MMFFQKKIIFLNFSFSFFLISSYCDFSTIDGVLDFFRKNDYVKEVFENTVDTNKEPEKAFEENDVRNAFKEELDVDPESGEQEFNSDLVLEEEFLCEDEEDEFMLWKKQYKRICFAPRLSEEILRVDHRYFEEE